MEVLPNLYLSDREFASCPSCLRERAITHVVTVDFVPLADQMEVCSLEKCKQDTQAECYSVPAAIRYFVSALDAHTTDLLADNVLTDCLDFIDEASRLDGNKVLVHCLVGRSRSAAVVIGHLMRLRSWTYQQASNFLTAKKPDVCPNWGFVEQLKLFHHMQYKVNLQSTLYKALMHELREAKLEPAEGESIAERLIEKHTRETSQKKIYKCRQCRKFSLFGSENCVSSHIDQSCTSCFLLEPEEWMYAQMGADVQGKFSCPNCKAKVGSFNWSGDRCSCQEWMTPALQINLSKVDPCLVEPS